MRVLSQRFEQILSLSRHRRGHFGRDGVESTAKSASKNVPIEDKNVILFLLVVVKCII